MTSILPLTIRFACFGAAIVCARTYGLHALAEFLERVSEHHGNLDLLTGEPIAPVRRAIGRAARAMADTYESADYRRSIGVERAIEESRILDKLNDWMSKHSPSVREIVEGDLDLTAVRRRFCDILAHSDPEEFGYDRLGSQIAEHLLSLSFKNLGSDKAFLEQMEFSFRQRLLQYARHHSLSDALTETDVNRNDMRAEALALTTGHFASSGLLTLYYAVRSSALAVHIALEDAGAKYKLRRIEVDMTRQNPIRSPAPVPAIAVPTMITPDGILTDTSAMLSFVAQSFPEAKLAPLRDPFAFSVLQSFNNYLCANLHEIHARRMREHNCPQESVERFYDLIESRMLKGPWVMGPIYTIADPYLYAASQWLEDDGVDLTKVPRIVEHRSLMAERPSVKKAIADELNG